MPGWIMPLFKKKKRWEEKEKGAKGCSAFGRMLAQDA